MKYFIGFAFGFLTVVLLLQISRMNHDPNGRVPINTFNECRSGMMIVVVHDPLIGHMKAYHASGKCITIRFSKKEELEAYQNALYKHILPD